MSESTRALCQIIEARPFLTLTDQELSLLAYLMERHSVTMSDPVSVTLYGRLRDEVASRRAFERGQRNAYDQADAAMRAIQSWGTKERAFKGLIGQCESISDTVDGISAVRCNGLAGHDGPHFVGHHTTRTEWS